MMWDFFSRPSRYERDLLASHGMDDAALNREIRRVLRHERFQRAIGPWVYAINQTWRNIYGRYWRARQKVHGSAAAPAGGSAGTQPTFSTFAGFTSAPTASGSSGSFEDAGIRAGEVVAYRCWLLKDGLLYSAYQSDFVWEPGKTAEGDPSQPMQGVHGFKRRYDACSYLSSFECLQDGTTIPVVSGTVELWGNVYEHTRGYRASKARIASIDDSPNYDAAALRKKYGLNRRRKRLTASKE